MANRYFKLIALAAVMTAAPSIATAQAAQAGAQPQPIARTTVVQDLGTSFKGVDTNGDGALSQTEIAAAETRSIQRRLSQIRTELEGQFTKADTNKDGQLSKAEFLAAGPQAPTTAPNGADIIAELDKNKDGKVSLAEFSADRLAAFDQLDTNHDGTLSLAERQAASQR